MKRYLTLLLAVLAIAGGLGWTVTAEDKSGAEVATPDPAAELTFALPELQRHEPQIREFLARLQETDVEELEAIEITPFKVPAAGIDVMRVRLEETYRIDGVGEDTVELRGWVAVAHGTPRSAPGETGVGWGSAISDTEFVGLELRGQSDVFGPVQVKIDRSNPAVGAVGRLSFSFLSRVSLDLAYAPHRQPHLRLPDADLNGTRLAWGDAAPLKNRVMLASDLEKGSHEEIEKVLRGVWAAIGEKDPEAMLRHFSSEPGVYFNSGLPRLKTDNAKEYVSALSRMFESIKSIKVIPNDDLTIRGGAGWAVATVTGRNEVVDLENRRGTGPWRWTVELKREGRRWVIAGDHLSFYVDPKSPLDAATAAAACAANVSVAVILPELNLRLTTKFPVSWYSEVETIPPVGETASVSMTPTALMSNGREVGTLESGVVKFREVVNHFPLSSAVGDV